MPRGDITKTELRIVSERANKVFFKSHYYFLNSHNGFRPGALHTFLGVSGGGKSTLVRSLILDVIKNIQSEKKVLLWLSEESYLDFMTEFGRTGFSDELKLKNLEIESEISLKIKSSAAMLDFFKKKCKNYDLVFLDNLTTSHMYEPLRPQEQGSVIKEIKTVADELQIPLILIAHTGGLVSENMVRIVDQNDVRGGKGIVNISQFFYVMQRFLVNERIYPTIRITKHRGQECTHKLHGLSFKSETRTYEGDVPLSFADFKKIFKQRNTL